MIFNFCALAFRLKHLSGVKSVTLELSQHDKDFAHAMALKLRLSLEKKDVIEKSVIGDSKMEIALIVVCVFMMHFH